MNILGFVDHTVSVTITQLCCCIMSNHRQYAIAWLCLNKTLFTERLAVDGIWPEGWSLPSPGQETRFDSFNK